MAPVAVVAVPITVGMPVVVAVAVVAGMGMPTVVMVAVGLGVRGVLVRRGVQ